MRLADLRVYHISKKRISNIPFVQGLESQPVFYLETCQRWMWIYDAQQGVTAQSACSFAGQELEGQDAYLFLLRFLCGLESEIAGETDVFGQFKMAWQTAQTTRSAWMGSLRPWIQRLFEDTKEMRSSYLQNLGGVSYGSLVRKLIRDQLGNPFDAPILLVGAGQLAHSVAPFLLSHPVMLSNRNPLRLKQLYQVLQQEKLRAGASLDCVNTPEDWMQAWERAQVVVFCVPPETCDLSQYVNLGDRLVIHLGGRKEELPSWSHLPRFFALDTLFSLQHSLGNIRSVQIARAEKACIERSLLRGLGTSLCIPHGWEDLATFA